ncbi:T-lymphocyte activation antigen CD86 [Apodemus speciosus]|uniref:T-lymphocyte activation antigen CD86 n=1 Tax=Apodemus speciosus TaxID=105296 RepID=A0ABQ0FM02_APOSI
MDLAILLFVTIFVLSALKRCARCTSPMPGSVDILRDHRFSWGGLQDAVSMKRQAYFNGTAYLPCPSTKAQNMTLSELVVFWQDKQNLVLYEHYLGTEKLDSVNAKYRGRTSFDGDNWTLRLHNVQIKDMGSYTCFIQKKAPTGSIIIQQTVTELSVIVFLKMRPGACKNHKHCEFLMEIYLIPEWEGEMFPCGNEGQIVRATSSESTANFSEPEIELTQNITRNSPINLTCSSKQGYPKPTKMYFLITNSTNERGDNMQISQDNVTELFSVSISLSLQFPDGVFNMTVMCILETESMNISSKHCNLVSPESQSDQENWIQIPVSISVVCCFAAVLSVFTVAKSYHKKQNQPGRPRGMKCTLKQDGSADRESNNLEELELQIVPAETKCRVKAVSGRGKLKSVCLK